MSERGAEDLRREAARLRGSTTTRVPRAASRLRITQGLLLFVVTAGASIALLQPLRARLVGRIAELGAGFAPIEVRTPPARAVVGENLYEFPKELERPASSARGLAGVHALPGLVFRPRSGDVDVAASSGEGEGSAVRPQDPAAPARPPEFRQGQLEREAYDLLLQRSPALAAMVAGNNAGLRFKSWAAARSDDGGFLVDLTFTSSSSDGTRPASGGESAPETHYIWKVQLEPKEIVPLSHSARSLQKAPS